jgi:hypothetical protein
MKTVHRQISCSVHGVLYAWGCTEWSKEEKAANKREYEAAIAPALADYNNAVAATRKAHWWNKGKLRAKMLSEARVYEATVDSFGFLKDSEPNMANWDQLFKRLKEHCNIRCELCFIETEGQPSAGSSQTIESS